MVITDRVDFLFADARALYDDALEILDQVAPAVQASSPNSL